MKKLKTGYSKKRKYLWNALPQTRHLYNLHSLKAQGQPQKRWWKDFKTHGLGKTGLKQYLSEMTIPLHSLAQSSYGCLNKINHSAFCHGWVRST